MPLRTLFVCGMLATLATGCASTLGRDERPPDPQELPPVEPESGGWSKEQKFIAVNAAAAAAVMLYGLRFWDYGSTGFQINHEGWFGKHTQYGGADKLGHAYSTYLATIGLAELYEYWGYEPERADLLGAYSAMGAFALIEVGDGFSKGGFSYEDLVVDAAGAVFAYLRRRNPDLARKLDFRVEYIPSPAARAGEKKDLVTDYSGFKYVLALKLDGFDAIKSPWLQALELQLGYYTRGYTNQDEGFFKEKSRNLYVAVGLNVAHLLRRLGLEKTATVFNYYQLPYTYLPLRADSRLPR